MIKHFEGVESTQSIFGDKCSCGINYVLVKETYKEHLEKNHLIIGDLT